LSLQQVLRYAGIDMTINKLKILVVDDDESIRGYITKLLKVSGYDTQSASCGRQALEQLRLDADIALVILDILMPEMDGLETLGEIRKISVDLPVLMLSALGQTVIIDHGGGYWSGYLYLQDVRVGVGDRVSSGTVIGHVGGDEESPQGTHIDVPGMAFFGRKEFSGLHNS